MGNMNLKGIVRMGRELGFLKIHLKGTIKGCLSIDHSIMCLLLVRLNGSYSNNLDYRCLIFLSIFYI
jgi:hypothetical protein